MLDLIFVALLQGVAGAPAEAQQTPPATQEASAEANAGADRVRDRNERRCRVETVTGSRLGARVCHSEAEREMLEREGRTFLEDGMRMWDSQSMEGGG